MSTYVYVASAPQDNTFVAKLSQDLTKGNISHWYDDGQAEEATRYIHLQKATHLIAILSPDALLHEPFLGAIEFAKQQHLPHIPLRRHPIESLPPQLNGSIPLDFTDDTAYDDALATLLEDFAIEDSNKPELPSQLLDQLHSEDTAIRHEAVQSLSSYRNNNLDDTMHQLAREELAALVFRERDPTLKALVTTMLQSFDQPLPETPPQPLVYTQEELDQQAEAQRQAQQQPMDTPEVIEPMPADLPQTVRYLWQSPRWLVILGGGALVIAGIALVVGGHWAYAVPIIVAGFTLPQMNIAIRQGGDFEWQQPNATIGNLTLGLLITGMSAGLLMALTGEGAQLLIASLIIGGVYGAIVGQLSTVKG